jgi:hypothetical protein
MGSMTGCRMRRLAHELARNMRSHTPYAISERDEDGVSQMNGPKTELISLRRMHCK